MSTAQSTAPAERKREGNIHLEHAGSEVPAYEIPDTKNVEGVYTVLGTSGQDPDKAQSVGFKTWIVVALAALGCFQNVFMAIAPAANSYTIAGALNGMDKRIWIVQAQGVPVVLAPVFGIIADVYGRRYVVLGCWALHVVSAVVGATAKNIEVVIISQAICGVGGAITGIMYAIPSEIVPNAYRAHVQTLVGVVAGLAAIPATVLMSALTGSDPINGWRWAFRILIILDAICLIGFGLFFFPPPRTPQQGEFWRQMSKLDWIGYGLLLGGLIPWLMGFAWASDMNYGWKDPHAYGCVVVGTVVFLLCLLYEWKGRTDGFLHHSLFKNGRNFPLLILAVSIEGSLFYIINNVYSAQVNSIWLPGAGIMDGVWLVPFYLVITVLAPILSIYATRTKDLKWPVVISFVVYTSAVVGFGCIGAKAKYAAIAFDVMAGVGFAAPLIFLVTMAQLSTPPLYIGVATALMLCARTLGGTVGYAIADAIYSNIAQSRVPKSIAEAVIPLGFDPANLGQLIGAILSHGDVSKVPGTTGRIIGAAYEASADANQHAYRIAWLAFIPAVVCAVIVTALIRSPKERMNWVVDAPLNTEQIHAEQGVDHVIQSRIIEPDQESIEKKPL